jgi:hypothetical protein
MLFIFQQHHDLYVLLVTTVLLFLFTGLDPDDRDGFEQCINEVQTNFEIGE